ncbi:hypothetical protein [Flectobacillus roseus]|uniref:hypothetical protein n=1 Tax=Flectobacillus roseus TaxID=502259 RepID=UPI0024B7A5E1|nr:hypothetical protein [Flectobacillus roseus]MDI9870604.1 hypothetical protein [Flectobacillus roseus]
MIEMIKYKPDESYKQTSMVELTKEEAIILSNLIIFRNNSGNAQLKKQRDRILDKLVHAHSLDVV